MAIYPFPASGDQAQKTLSEILQAKGLLTKLSVERMAESATARGMQLGPFLERTGLITSEELADALAAMYRCRKILDFAKYKYHPMLLRTVPLEMAVEHTIFPLKLDEGKLGLAVLDPSNKAVLEAIETRLNIKVIPFVSTRTDIGRAIARHYLGTNLTPHEKSVLLVEDDTLTRTVISDILTKHGYVVESATDGMEAFKKIFTQNPKLVITDKVMPKLNGYEFLQAVRKIPEFRFTPVILMTANATGDEEKVAFEKGFFDLILKPIREIGLVTRVRRAFQSGDGLYGQIA
ncbi:MAG TPA: response regulator [Geobacteraceae bacterium]